MNDYDDTAGNPDFKGYPGEEEWWEAQDADLEWIEREQKLNEENKDELF